MVKGGEEKKKKKKKLANSLRSAFLSFVVRSFVRSLAFEKIDFLPRPLQPRIRTRIFLIGITPRFLPRIYTSW